MSSFGSPRDNASFHIPVKNTNNTYGLLIKHTMWNGKGTFLKKSNMHKKVDEQQGKRCKMKTRSSVAVDLIEEL